MIIFLCSNSEEKRNAHDRLKKGKKRKRISFVWQTEHFKSYKVMLQFLKKLVNITFTPYSPLRALFLFIWPDNGACHAWKETHSMTKITWQCTCTTTKEQSYFLFGDIKDRFNKALTSVVESLRGSRISLLPAFVFVYWRSLSAWSSTFFLLPCRSPFSWWAPSALKNTWNVSFVPSIEPFCPRQPAYSSETS